ncbi:D-2-hydroxyacid dehydrogenase [Hominifimenecus sp. rT4P-3]|uniref:D-2-hydroxyacid dehydrogenase n=1 Tax=Hominifimenecus sp. rT4P-3 TaxID=3242979 RepID=UPI003DA2C5CE
MEIAVLDGYSMKDLDWGKLKAVGNVRFYDRTPLELLRERIGEAEIVLTNKVVLDEAILSQCPSLRYIGVTATGYNIVDVEAARKRGIVVTNVPAYGTESVSQFTMALLLELCYHVGLHAESVRQGEWIASHDFCYWKAPLSLLTGKTLGILGYGKIGKRVAALAQAFGMHVLVTTPHPNPDEAEAGIQFAAWEELLAKADVISLHCPLTEKTSGIICRESIEKMKDGVWILNVSRGPLVVEADLRDALLSGKVAMAACDVIGSEPMPPDSLLRDVPNLLVTPHIAWAADEARKKLLEITIENVLAFLTGNPVHVVS